MNYRQILFDLDGTISSLKRDKFFDIVGSNLDGSMPEKTEQELKDIDPTFIFNSIRELHGYFACHGRTTLKP
ncbi:MAG: hypothetical protein ABSG94_03245 [Brevinematales bacterium]